MADIANQGMSGVLNEDKLGPGGMGIYYDTSLFQY